MPKTCYGAGWGPRGLGCGRSQLSAWFPPRRQTSAPGTGQPSERALPWRMPGPRAPLSKGEFLQPQLTEPDGSPILPHPGEAWVTQMQCRGVECATQIHSPSATAHTHCTGLSVGMCEAPPAWYLRAKPNSKTTEAPLSCPSDLMPSLQAAARGEQSAPHTDPMFSLPPPACDGFLPGAYFPAGSGLGLRTLAPSVHLCFLPLLHFFKTKALLCTSS